MEGAREGNGYSAGILFIPQRSFVKLNYKENIS